jgi:hypothetical protein
MKINKYYLKQLILEELIKELQGPPKKPPTKIKPKAKPKPEERSMKFAYLLKGEYKEHNFSKSEIDGMMKSAGMGNLGTRDGKTKEEIEDMEFFNFSLWTVPLIYRTRYHGHPYDIMPASNHYYVFKNGISTLRNQIIPAIPELQGLMGQRYEQGYTYGSGEDVPGNIIEDRPLNIYYPETFLKAIWYENFGGEKYLEKVGDKVLRKYSYYHGFMPIFTEIKNIPNHFEGEIDYIDGIFPYYNYIFKNFAPERQKQARQFIRSKMTGESPAERSKKYEEKQREASVKQPDVTNPVGDLEKFIKSQTDDKSKEDKKEDK